VKLRLVVPRRQYRGFESPRRHERVRIEKLHSLVDRFGAVVNLAPLRPVDGSFNLTPHVCGLLKK
jgi:hypothetical protein